MDPLSILQGGMYLKKGYDWFTAKAPTGRDHTNYDPIASLITIALLPYKEEKTRVKVTENRLILQQPSNYTYGINLQGVFRFFQGDKRQDLAVLEPLIYRAANILQPSKNEIAQKLFFKISIGMKQLSQSTYNENTDNDKCMRTLLKSWNQLVGKAAVLGIGEHSLTLKDEKVKKLWTANNVLTVQKWLQEAELAKQDNNRKKILSYVKAIETFLDNQAKRLLL